MTLNRLMRLMFLKTTTMNRLMRPIKKNNDSESTHILNTDDESTQATLDLNWAHEHYRQLRLCIEIGMCL